jgi:hypothetical protein
MKVLYNISMSNAKNAVKETIEVRVPPRSPFPAFSRFGNQTNRLGGPKFNPKTFNARPTFVTQHKGGGGK